MCPPPLPPQIDEDQESMVLRTVYLPPELDEALKKLAFNSSTSKGALIRQAIHKLMIEKAPESITVSEPDDTLP